MDRELLLPTPNTVAGQIYANAEGKTVLDTLNLKTVHVIQAEMSVN